MVEVVEVLLEVDELVEVVLEVDELVEVVLEVEVLEVVEEVEVEVFHLSSIRYHSALVPEVDCCI